MIQSFKCNDTQALHQRHRVARWVNIEAVARRKLNQLDAAGELCDVASPPGNRLAVSYKSGLSATGYYKIIYRNGAVYCSMVQPLADLIKQASNSHGSTSCRFSCTRAK